MPQWHKGPTYQSEKLFTKKRKKRSGGDVNRKAILKVGNVKIKVAVKQKINIWCYWAMLIK